MQLTRRPSVTFTSVVASLVGALTLALLLAACGEKKTHTPRRRAIDKAPRIAPRRTEARRPPPRGPERPVVTGIMGTIDAEAVAKAFNEKIRDIGLCRRTHIAGLPYVGGAVRIFFKIGLDGVPLKVVMEKSELGNHALESCLRKIARSLRFSKPEGGTAEVRYTMSLANEGTDAKQWPASKVQKTLAAQNKALKRCRKGGKPAKFTVTFYVLPGGKVKSVGAVGKGGVPAGFGACVAKVVKGLTFADPLGEVARVSVTF